jgi:hypothetical protein
MIKINKMNKINKINKTNKMNKIKFIILMKKEYYWYHIKDFNFMFNH